jgi:hypothetical protein
LGRKLSLLLSLEGSMNHLEASVRKGVPDLDGENYETSLKVV